MRLKLISDGTPVGTSVVDADTGERVDLIQKVNYEIGVGDIYGRLTMEVMTEDVEIVCDVDDEFGDLTGIF